MPDDRRMFAISRRGTLAGIGASAAAAALPGQLSAQTTDPVFRHGVASGDPDATSVVLWTRATVDAPGEVEWELAETRAFSRIVKSGRVAAGPDSDYTVKVLAEGLRPGATYYYRFRSRGITSPVGCARTLARGSLARLGIALASCSNYAFGHFNAYDAIARDGAVDFVLHVGDYIYEYGADGYGGHVGKRIGRLHEPAHEIVSLADYRQRHAQYKADPGLQAMHAAHTLLACWDDHESANNPWASGAQNHQPDREGDWNARRAASIQAYFEWMPVREPLPGRTRMQFWRSYSFGDLATLCTLETRHTARALQVEYGAWRDRIQSPADAERLLREEIGATGRRLLAPEQETDLGEALRRSVADGQRWRLIGSPVVIARTIVPDLVTPGLIPDATKGLGWIGKWQLPLYTDSWDGYPWARERLYDLSREAGAGDLIVLSGDSHKFWANRLADAARRPAGIEFSTSGVTSPSDFMLTGLGEELTGKLDQALAEHNDEMVWTDSINQGYVRIELTAKLGKADFIAVDTVLNPTYRARNLKSFTFARRNGMLEFV